MSGTLRNAKARWTRGIGTAVCRMRKLAAGSYSRELRARSFRGYDLGGFAGVAPRLPRPARSLLRHIKGPWEGSMARAAMNSLGPEPRRRYRDAKGMRVLRAR
jgi:hypothetical protein